METRASYVIVGLFVFAMFASAMGFVIWLGKVELNREVAHYDIEFEQQVTGLSVGSPVRYRGIPVGQVLRIGFDPDNVEIIRVRVELDTKVPIKQDVYAVLESQGLTGVGFIQLAGGSKDAPLLTVRPGDEVPVLPSQNSVLQEVAQAAPEIASQLVVLVNRANQMLDPQNQTALRNTLSNLEQFSGALASRSGELERIIENLNLTMETMEATVAQVSGDIGVMSEEISQTMATTRGTVNSLDSEIVAVSDELKIALRNVSEVSSGASALIRDNRDAVNDFATTGLYELTEFLIDGRQLMNDMSQLVRQVESDPSRILFGNRQRGVETDR
ncbi:MCE family protein [Nisaea acidiphila]|uniref:MCE family protein n=1 Tax=Nisaea acidiphila TaxID=1862145 RepID=A0A9J7AQL7_9PROT|nr:MlaD family protein [Nisaea acidiphila]UUX49462.1 MCE family protein [Nisaea acidiphila]